MNRILAAIVAGFVLAVGVAAATAPDAHAKANGLRTTHSMTAGGTAAR